MSRRLLEKQRQKTRGALTWEALIAVGVLALTALLVTSLSIRMLVLIRQTAKVAAREQLARSTIASVEADHEALRRKTKTLDPVSVEGMTYRREVTIRELEERLLEMEFRLTEDLSEGQVGRTYLYTKRVNTP